MKYGMVYIDQSQRLINENTLVWNSMEGQEWRMVKDISEFHVLLMQPDLVNNFQLVVILQNKEIKEEDGVSTELDNDHNQGKNLLGG